MEFLSVCPDLTDPLWGYENQKMPRVDVRQSSLLFVLLVNATDVYLKGFHAR